MQELGSKVGMLNRLDYGGETSGPCAPSKEEIALREAHHRFDRVIRLVSSSMDTETLHRACDALKPIGIEVLEKQKSQI